MVGVGGGVELGVGVGDDGINSIVATTEVPEHGSGGIEVCVGVGVGVWIGVELGVGVGSQSKIASKSKILQSIVVVVVVVGHTPSLKYSSFMSGQIVVHGNFPDKIQVPSKTSDKHH
jgi:hypothetical protein